MASYSERGRKSWLRVQVAAWWPGVFLSAVVALALYWSQSWTLEPTIIPEDRRFFFPVVTLISAALLSVATAFGAYRHHHPRLPDGFADVEINDRLDATLRWNRVWRVLRDFSSVTVAFLFVWGFWTYPQSGVFRDTTFLSISGITLVFFSCLMLVSWNAWAIGLIALLDDESFVGVAPRQGAGGLAGLRAGICEYCGVARSGSGDETKAIYAPVRCSSCESYQWANLQRLSRDGRSNFQLALFVVVHRLELSSALGLALIAGAITYGVDAKGDLHRQEEERKVHLRRATSDTIAAFVANRSTMRRHMDCVVASESVTESEACTKIAHDTLDSYYHFSWYAPELVRELLPICPSTNAPPSKSEENYVKRRQWYACAGYGAVNFVKDPTQILKERCGGEGGCQELKHEATETWVRQVLDGEALGKQEAKFQDAAGRSPPLDYASWDLLDQVDSRFARWQHLRQRWITSRGDAHQASLAQKEMVRAAQDFLDDSALLGCILGELGATPDTDIHLPGDRFVDMRRCRGKLEYVINDLYGLSEEGEEVSTATSDAEVKVYATDLPWVPANYLHLLRIEEDGTP